jgi:hypothetical protein
MRVNDPNVGALGPETLRGTGATQPAEALRSARGGRGPAGSGDGTDRVALSEWSGRVQELAVDSPERAARIEKLSAEVRTGRYQADPLLVSQRLVEEALKPRP